MSEDYMLKKAVQSYFEATMEYNIKEVDLTDLKRSDNFIFIFTNGRVYLKRFNG